MQLRPGHIFRINTCHALICDLYTYKYILYIYRQYLYTVVWYVLYHTSGDIVYPTSFIYIFHVQTCWEHSMGHEVVWAIYIVCACNACACVLRADYLHTCWEHTTNHHKLHGLCIFHVQAPCTHVNMCVVKWSIIVGRIISILKFSKHILITTGVRLQFTWTKIHQMLSWSI
jgi:hypothetical protein